MERRFGKKKTLAGYWYGGEDWLKTVEFVMKT